MGIKYFVDDKEFSSPWQVRQYLGKREVNAKIFGQVPDGDDTAFWAELGVRKVVEPDPPPPEPTPEEIAAAELSKAKRMRAAQVAAIQVEVDGMLFEGDETSQNRMSNAIHRAALDGTTSYQWVLADGTTAEVSVEQLKQAFSAAHAQLEAAWTKPYEVASDEVH